MKIEEKKFKTGYSLKYKENIIELLMLEKGWYEFKLFRIKDTKNIKLISELGKRFYEFAITGKCTIMTEATDRDKKQNKFMDNCGIKIRYSKHLFKKNLEIHSFLYDDIFKYQSLNEAGTKKFYKIFRASIFDPIGTFTRFEKYIERIKKEYINDDSINYWKLIYLDNKPMAVIMPYIYPAQKEKGTLLEIGLLPDERGKGYGRIIHSRGLMILKEMGAKKYIGSTETDNHAMLKVFKINGCRKLFIRHFYKAI